MFTAKSFLYHAIIYFKLYTLSQQKCFHDNIFQMYHHSMFFCLMGYFLL